MNNIEIFDPAMCCSTGLCGPSIDPELLRISTVVNVLNKKGFNVIRHNLSQKPQAYVTNIEVSNLLKSKGVNALPITILNGEIVKSGSYPTNKEISRWLGIKEFELSARKLKNPNSCCSGKPGCC